MPKLLQINSTANWGSTGKIAEQIGELAMAHGWESYIAYGRSSNKSKSHLIRIGSKVGQAWHLIISRLFDKHGLGSRYATKRLIREIEVIKPDIIHLHNIHGYYINYKLLFEYLNSTDTPIVWTLHDCWAFTGHCAHFVEAGCDKWQYECGNCCNIKTYPKSKTDNSMYNFHLKQRLFTSLKNRLNIITVSKWLESETTKSFFKNTRINHLYNGVDSNIFKPTYSNNLKLKYSIDEKFLIVSIASIWDENKGLNDLIRLSSILTDKYVIMIIGRKTEQVLQTYPNIISIPRTDSQLELAEIYSQANAVISTSRQETFGLTLAEGMACGTPAIAYNNTALPELITNSTGAIVEHGDIDGLAQAIKTICNNGKDYYRDACREHALKHFDKTTCFEKYIDLYGEILAKKL